MSCHLSCRPSCPLSCVFHIASHIILLKSPNIPSGLSLLWSKASVSHYVRFSSRWGAQLHIPTSSKVAAPAQDEKEKMKNNNAVNKTGKGFTLFAQKIKPYSSPDIIRYSFFSKRWWRKTYSSDCQTFCFPADHRNHQEELHAVTQVTRVTRHTSAAENLLVLGAGHYHRCYCYRRSRTVQGAGSRA